MNRNVNCLDGKTKSLKVVQHYRNGVLCYDPITHDFHVVDHDKNVELDMDVTELVTLIKPWSYV